MAQRQAAACYKTFQSPIIYDDDESLNQIQIHPKHLIIYFPFMSVPLSDFKRNSTANINTRSSFSSYHNLVLADVQEMASNLDNKLKHRLSRTVDKELANKLTILTDPLLRPHLLIYQLYCNLQKLFTGDLDMTLGLAEIALQESMRLVEQLQSNNTFHQYSRQQLSRLFYCLLKSLLRQTQAKKTLSKNYSEQLIVLQRVVSYRGQSKRWRILYYEYLLLIIEQHLQRRQYNHVQTLGFELLHKLQIQLEFILIKCFEANKNISDLNRRHLSFVRKLARLMMCLFQCLIMAYHQECKIRSITATANLAHFIASMFLTPTEIKLRLQFHELMSEFYHLTILEENEIIQLIMPFFKAQIVSSLRSKQEFSITEFFNDRMNKLFKYEEKEAFQYYILEEKEQQEDQKVVSRLSLITRDILDFSTDRENELLQKYSTDSLTIKNSSSLAIRRQLKNEVQQLKHVKSWEQIQSERLQLRMTMQRAAWEDKGHISHKDSLHELSYKGSANLTRENKEGQQNKPLRGIKRWQAIILKHRNVFPLLIFRAKKKKNVEMSNIKSREFQKIVELSSMTPYNKATHINQVYLHLNQAQRDKLNRANRVQRTAKGLGLRMIRSSLIRSIDKQ